MKSKFLSIVLIACVFSFLSTPTAIANSSGDDFYIFLTGPQAETSITFIYGFRDEPYLDLDQLVVQISADNGQTWSDYENFLWRTPDEESDGLITLIGLPTATVFKVQIRLSGKDFDSNYWHFNAATLGAPSKPEPVPYVYLVPKDFTSWSLSWQEADSLANEETLYSYSIRMHGKKSWSSWKDVGTNSIVTLKKLTIGSKYDFRIRSSNSFGYSISKTEIVKIRKFSTPKKPGNLCERNNQLFKQTNGNVLSCTKGRKQTWLLLSSKNWPKSRIKSFNQILKQLNNEAKVISKVVNRGDSSSIAATSLLFEKSLEILSQVDSMPKGISYNNFIATTTVLRSEADLAAWEWFNGDAWSGRNRYQAILVVLNKLFTKLNNVLGTTYKIPYVVM